jgi:Transglutaminase-like superfamily
MKKIIAIMAITTLAALGSASCGKKKAAPKPGPESGSAPTSSAQPAVAAPPDPAHAALANATRELAAVVGAPGAAGAAAQVGKAIDSLAAAMPASSREAWDPAAVVAAVGSDRVALFTWVRDHTALVPYRGSLRGATGVLMDRVGNSLDRALLLAELCKAAGVEVRLAQSTLTPEVVERLSGAWAARARPALPASAIDGAAVLATLVGDLGLDAKLVNDKVGKAEAATATLVERARARITSQARAVAATVKPGVSAAPAGAELADHWWVQVQDNGVWQDLDPSLPDAEPGQALGVVGETIDPGALPDDQRHTLTVRVIGEVWHDQTREDATLLEHTLAPASFYGQRISLTNIPLDLPDEATLLASQHPAADARAALVAQTEWIPVLAIGSRIVAKMSVTDGGELYDVTAPDANTTRLARAVQRATKAGVGGATDLLDSLPGSPDDTGAAPAAKPPAPKSAGFTREWIELEIRAPGTAPKIARRLVFDALDGADRATAHGVTLSDAAKLERALALIGETELLPMFARIPDAFVVDRFVKALVAGRAALVEAAAVTAAKQEPTSELRRKLAAIAVPGTVYGLALARFAWSPVAEQVYLDQLDLLTRRRRLVAVGGELRMRDGFDIVANAVAVWPGQGDQGGKGGKGDKGGNEIDARATRIAQGVADTAAEAFALGCPAASPKCVRAATTSDEYAVSGSTWTVIPAGTTPALPQLPAAARVLALADLAAGYAIVVPPAAPAGTAVTWWRVDPQTGETLGMGLAGGNVQTETVIQMFVTLINGVGCFMNMPPGSGHGLILIGCVAATGIGFFGPIIGLAGGNWRFLGYAMTIIGALIGVAAPNF